MQPKYYGAAAQYNKPAGFSSGGGVGGKKIAMLAGLILFVIIIIVGGLSLVTSLSKGPQDDFVALAARTSNLQALLEKQKPTIKNADLKKLNAEATTLLITNSNDLSEQASKLFGVAEIPETVTEAQGMGDAEEALEKAKLSGTFDRVYITTVTDKVNGTFDLAKKMSDAVSSQDAKAVLEQTMANLVLINDQLSKIQL
ncbi:MAG TPA: hypothetical protein VLA88_01240 [Candidatus Saccharimonadales bacterium]|nr:hypothetical protein [Candidatus Saccharimonadales bacterium]